MCYDGDVSYDNKSSNLFNTNHIYMIFLICYIHYYFVHTCAHKYNIYKQIICLLTVE